MGKQMKKRLEFNVSCAPFDLIDSCKQPFEGQMMFNAAVGKMMVYSNGMWIELTAPSDHGNARDKKHPTVCPNCGAPHNPESRVCEYCGTYFE